MLNDKTVGFIEVLNNRFHSSSFINRKTDKTKTQCQGNKFHAAQCDLKNNDIEKNTSI